MALRVRAVEATDRFVGSIDDPLQLVRVTLVNTGPETLGPMPVRVRLTGDRIEAPRPIALASMVYGDDVAVDVPVRVTGARPGTHRSVVVVVETAAGLSQIVDRHASELVVAEPGWTVHLVSHFHYDPVWWTTQAAYTATWDAYETAGTYRAGYQHSAFPLIEAHLELAARDPDYKFVLAELDYLKPFWNAHPERRAALRRLIADGRVELVGGMYNEPNTNLTSAELTARNAVHGFGYQRDVLGGDPRTAWQLDTFGHDPQFPGMLADAGLDASAWARGPFHQWGPRVGAGDARRMQFPSEFEWLSPSGRGLLTSYLPAHYSPGWLLDSAPTLADAELVVYRLYQDLKGVAATRNVLLPVGTDCTPPSRWLTEVARSWNDRYVWPRFVVGLPREFFAAVRAEAAERRVHLLPQSRDMNPVYTGKDVSFIDTKQAQRAAENLLADAEKFATLAASLGAGYPAAALDKAWRLLVFGAHHDAITGSESDQVYLDLLGGWREAWELGRTVHGAALAHLAGGLDTAGPRGAPEGGLAVTVFNPMSWPRTDAVSVRLPAGAGLVGVGGAGEDAGEGGGGATWRLLDADGREVPCELRTLNRPPAVEGEASPVKGPPAPEAEPAADDAPVVGFVATDVPPLGWRTWWLVPGEGRSGVAVGPRVVPGARIENDRFVVEVDPERGGAISRLHDRRAERDLLTPGQVGNELLRYEEYPQHPVYGEGPWHLLPTGPGRSLADGPATVTATTSPVARRLTATRRVDGLTITQEITLWHGLDRVDLRTHLDGWEGADELLRVRFPLAVEGALPLAEVGNAVVARNFGLPDVDAAEHPWTLDNPVNNWFGLGATARVRLLEPDAGQGGPVVAERALGVAEIVLPDRGEDQAATRALAVALVRAGVTSTCTRAGGRRYGSLDVDSNLPDVRVAVGEPAANAFTAAVLADADPDFAAELARQLRETGTARVWVPARRPLTEAWVPDADLRGERDLPVLIVAGAGGDELAGATRRLAEDLADAVVEVVQPAALATGTGRLDDRTVALLNRGIPGSCATPSGDVLLSLLRSCTGWPSGVWIDQPKRATPDGSGFQLQHWSHTFEYAVVACDGDWRAGGVVRHGHDYNHPLVATAGTAGTVRAGGTAAAREPLPASASLLSVEPAEVVLTTLKPTGNPLARQAGDQQGAAGGITLRCYESAGRATEAVLRCHWPLTSPKRADLLEAPGEPLPEGPDGAVRLRLDGAEVATVTAVPGVPATAAGEDSEDGTGGAPPDAASLGPRAEPAQPLYSRYWLHNKGPAPLGNQPLSVHVEPQHVTSSDPFTLDVTVASDATAGAHAGKARLLLPDGWAAEPAEHPFDLEAGGYARFSSTVSPPGDEEPGRRLVVVELADGGQTWQDAVRVDWGEPGEDGSDADTPRSGGLGWLGGGPPELVAELRTEVVAAAPGGTATLVVAVRNEAADPIRGEGQLLSPLETWPLLTPWTAGFEVAAGATTDLTYRLRVPDGTRPGRWWALVKLMWYGRVHYTAPAVVEVTG